MNTYHYLLDQYGPLMTLNDVAKLLKRSPNGLRVCSYRNYELSNKLNAAKFYVGRRLYYHTQKIADLISPNEAN